MREKLEARCKEIEVEFKELQGATQSLTQQLQNAQQQLLRLDGEHAGIKKLLGEDKVVDIKKQDYVGGLTRLEP